MLSSPNLLALNPAKKLNEYLARAWTVEFGLPQNSINALVQSHNGYVWIGTPSGLVRFDGIQFKTFTRLNTPALKNDKILALYEDDDNVLWIGTDGGGLCSYTDGTWKNFTTQDGLSNNSVRAITSDWQGHLWVGTEYGLNRLNMEGFQIYSARDGLYDDIITALTVDNWGNLWIGTMRGGLAKFKEKVFRVYDYDDGLSNMTIYALLADYMGNIWIGTQEGLYFLEQGEGIVRPIPGTLYTPITSIIEDANGTLWIGTMADGLKRRSDGVIEGLSTENGFPDDFIHSLLKDRDGNIWIGTDTGGLVQLKDRLVKNITKKNGLLENAIHAVLQDKEGSFWIGTRNSGLCKMTDDRIAKIIDKKTGLSSNRIRVLFEDNKGELWIGTEGGGINRLRKGRIALFNTKHGLSSDNVTAILQDTKEALWIGTDNGLNRFSDGRIHVYDNRIGLSNPYIRVLLETREGILYVGTRGGLFKLSGSSFNKLFPESGVSEFDVISLYEDRDGVLWIGTNGNGLTRWFNGEMISYTTEEGLHDNTICSITEDDIGNLWMSSYKGVFRVSRKELNDFSDKKTFSITPTCYDEADGMESRQCAGGSQPSFYKSNSGKLYYPTVKGIVIFDPETIPKKSEPPNVIIEDMLADNISVIDGEDIKLSYKLEMLEIHFTAFDFSAPEKIRFRYKLEGHDPDFIDVAPNTERIANYFNLDSGKYRFIVKASNNDGIWNEQGAFIEFDILYPFYKKPFFFFILVLTIFFIIGGSILVQHRKKIKKRLEKYKTSALDPERVEEIMPQLLHLMEEEKIFLNPDLTLKELSQRLRIHYNHLSQIINERLGLSYNDFINKYRIDEAKRRLVDPAEKEKNVLEIMYDTGFYSKSVFNTAFKKITGMTPSEYRKKHS